MKIAITGIVLGVAVMLLTISVVLGFKQEITSKITGLTTHIAVSSVSMNSSNEPEPIRVSADSLQQLKALPAIEHVQGTIFKSGILKTKTDNEGLLLKGVGSDYDFTFLSRNLVEGRLPQLNGDSASKDILISKNLSDKLGLKLGDRMQIHFIVQYYVFDSTAMETLRKTSHGSRRPRICGIYNTDFADFDDNLAFVDIRQIRNLNHWDQDMVGSYEVRIRDFRQLDLAKESVEELLGYGYNVNTVKELYANVFMWLDKLDINGVVVIVLMILVAVINMITALLILILERTNMIGLLKALGMTNSSLRNIFMHISAKLVLKGLLWGNIAGIGLCYLQYYFQPVKLDSSTYYVDHVAVEINWLYFLYLNAGTVIVCFAMLLLPTLILSRLTPVKTLRFD